MAAWNFEYRLISCRIYGAHRKGNHPKCPGFIRGWGRVQVNGRQTVEVWITCAAFKNRVLYGYSVESAIAMSSPNTFYRPCIQAVSDLNDLNAKDDALKQAKEACSMCGFGDLPLACGENESWVECNACARWSHASCALLNTRNETSDDSLFHCAACIIGQRGE